MSEQSLMLCQLEQFDEIISFVVKLLHWECTTYFQQPNFLNQTLQI